MYQAQEKREKENVQTASLVERQFFFLFLLLRIFPMRCDKVRRRLHSGGKQSGYITGAVSCGGCNKCFVYLKRLLWNLYLLPLVTYQ